MKELVERSLVYSVGGMVGMATGYAIVTFLPLPEVIKNEMALVVIISIIMGVLTSIIFQKHKEIKTLNENNNIRNETVALITHEMRTGLTSTGWAIQMILKKYPDQIQQSDKDMLDNVIKSIYTTITHSVNLLDISLIDIGKLSVALENTTLNKVEELFKETLEKFDHGTKQNGITFTSDIHLDSDRQAEIDSVRLRIILENLLENSIQYTTNEKKEIHVFIYNDKSNIIIEVSDTGIGIPDKEKENIFKEFYRAQNARAVLSSGSGIGLYTTAQYVKAHKGKIRFDSKEGVGTTFYITIPLKTIADVGDFLDKI